MVNSSQAVSTVANLSVKTGAALPGIPMTLAQFSAIKKRAETARTNPHDRVLRSPLNIETAAQANLSQPKITRTDLKLYPEVPEDSGPSVECGKDTLAALYTLIRDPKIRGLIKGARAEQRVLSGSGDKANV